MQRTTAPPTIASTSHPASADRSPGEQGTVTRTPMLMYLVLLVAAVLIITAFAPLLPVDWWWVRAGDFPRVQMLVAYLLWVGVLVVFHHQPFAKTAAALLLTGAGIQVYWIFPYLPGAPRQVEWAKSTNADVRLKILTANVLQDNDEAAPLLKLIESESPDVVVLCEVNQRWINDLAPLRERFKHHVEHPLENEYGIALYTNLELVSSQVRAMVKESIPSIDAVVRLRSGHPVRLFAVHPNPPRPGEDTTKRDAELVLVGREVRDSGSVVVLGDMNDVGWSRTTKLFQKVSGLLDPRRGRGLYATFNAKSRIWRYPLDHLFHSNDFRVVSLQTSPPIGSDHLPLSVVLSYEPDAETKQAAPDLKPDDRKDAEAAVDALNKPGALEEPDD